MWQRGLTRAAHHNHDDCLATVERLTVPKAKQQQVARCTEKDWRASAELEWNEGANVQNQGEMVARYHGASRRSALQVYCVE